MTDTPPPLPGPVDRAGLYPARAFHNAMSAPPPLPGPGTTPQVPTGSQVWGGVLERMTVRGFVVAGAFLLAHALLPAHLTPAFLLGDAQGTSRAAEIRAVAPAEAERERLLADARYYEQQRLTRLNNREQALAGHRMISTFGDIACIGGLLLGEPRAAIGCAVANAARQDMDRSLREIR